MSNDDDELSRRKAGYGSGGRPGASVGGKPGAPDRPAAQKPRTPAPDPQGDPGYGHSFGHGHARTTDEVAQPGGATEGQPPARSGGERSGAGGSYGDWRPDRVAKGKPENRDGPADPVNPADPGERGLMGSQGSQSGQGSGQGGLGASQRGFGASQQDFGGQQPGARTPAKRPGG